MGSDYTEYEWAKANKWMHPVRLEGDDRRWYYTAKKMHKGVMHARLEGFDHDDHPVKKLHPLSKVTFIPKKEWKKLDRTKRH